MQFAEGASRSRGAMDRQGHDGREPRPVPRTRQLKPRRSAALALCAILVTSLGTVATPPAEAVFATASGGSGRYQEVIDWIDWSDSFGTVRTPPSSPGGAAPSLLTTDGAAYNWTTPTNVGTGFWRASRCSVRVDSGSGGTTGMGAVRQPGVFAYTPGEWRGDGLARLYNNAVNYTAGALTGSDTSGGLRIALAGFQYGSNGATTVDFTVNCATYLIESAQSPSLSPGAIPSGATQIPLAGIVVADGESNNSYESLAAAPITTGGATATWHLLESVRNTACTTNSIATNSTVGGLTGLQFSSSLTLSGGDASQCSTTTTGGYGPGSVNFMEGATGVKARLVGNGRSAIAFGVVSYMDFGDAPASYGGAGAVFQPTWSGGAITPSGGASYNLTSAAAAGNVGKIGNPNTILGKLIDAEKAPYASADARGDDIHDGNGGTASVANDEDGVVPANGYVTEPGKSVTQQVSCKGPGQVAGWLDWNANGVFDTGERSNQVACSNQSGDGTATLTWTVPSDAKAGKTFLRVRITNDLASGQVIALKPTGMTMSGEVEDYQVTVKVPTLTLKKNLPGRFAASDQFALSIKRGTATIASATTTGGEPGIQPTAAGPVAVNTGTAYTLSESGAGGTSLPNYTTSWSCTAEQLVGGKSWSMQGKGAGTIQIDSFPKSDDALNPIAVTCTNTPINGAVKWSKVDGAKLLSGSEWKLTGPAGASQTYAVTDCTASGCQGPDKNPAAGQFEVNGLLWGTYTLVETKAPAGYKLDPTPRSVDISAATVTVDLGAIKNTAIPPATVTIRKTLQDTAGQNPVPGAGWSVGATLGSPTPTGTAITTPASATTGTDGAVAKPWSITFAGEADTAPVVVTETQQPGYTFVSGTCTVTGPTGAQRSFTLSDEAGTLASGSNRLAPGDKASCEFINRQRPGSVNWTKVAEGDAGKLLAGSEWKLTGPTTQVVADCVAGSPAQCTGPDKDPAPGAFTLDALPWGAYTLVETKAPAGYILDTTPRTFTVGPGSGQVAVLAPYTVGQFGNKQQKPPVLPLTGGIGTDTFLFLGGILVLLAAGGGWLHTRRSARARHA